MRWPDWRFLREPNWRVAILFVGMAAVPLLLWGVVAASGAERSGWTSFLLALVFFVLALVFGLLGSDSGGTSVRRTPLGEAQVLKAQIVAVGMCVFGLISTVIFVVEALN